MNPLAMAMTGQQILKTIGRNPQSRQIIDFALSQGLDESDVANLLSGGHGLTESQRSDLERKLKGKERVKSLLKGITTAGAVVGAGLGAYSLYQGGKTLAQSIMGTGASNQGPSLAQSIMGDISPSQPPRAPESSSAGSTLASMASPIMNLFGFKNKALIDAVSGIAKATGNSVERIYEALKKNQDLSTPEKAAAAAQGMLKELTGEGKTLKSEDIQAKESAREKLETARPMEEVRKDLAKNLKSSVIRKLVYNPEKERLKIIFNNDATYDYDDFPEDQFKRLSAGATPAKTSGSNEYGMWWVGKNPSLGATFNEIIKPSLKQNGPYKYNRGSDTPITKEELEELHDLQLPLMEKGETILRSEEKVDKAKEALKGIPKTPLNENQRLDRSRTLLRQAESLKSKEPSERKQEAIDLIEKRLQTLKQMDSLANRKKIRMIDEEYLRYEQHNGETIVKKLLAILPKAIASEIKDQVKNMSETEILKFISTYMKSRK